MIIETPYQIIEIKSKGYYTKESEGGEIVKLGSQIIKVLLEKVSIDKVKIDYEKGEKDE